MNPNDFKQRGVKPRHLDEMCKKYDLKLVKFGVNDIRERDLISNLFTAAQHLYSMVNSLKLNVYVHCCSGLTRAPAVVMAYLSLYKQHKCWNSIDDLKKFMHCFNPKLKPNARAVAKCIE